MRDVGPAALQLTGDLNVMNIDRESSIEDEICAHLEANGWRYDEGDAALYDRSKGIYVPDFIDWVRFFESNYWFGLEREFVHAYPQIMTVDKLRWSLDTKGTSDVLRVGIELFGLGRTLMLAQFMPASRPIQEIDGYKLNTLRVIRQVRYSTRNENCLDLVLFLNGLPVATAVLKAGPTETIEDAVDQYRFEHDPNPEGQPVEPLLTFPGGALFHFAVSNSEVRMTTKLEGSATIFLPFNRVKGDGLPGPDSYPIAYLWEESWQRDNWLDFIRRYIGG